MVYISVMVSSSIARNRPSFCSRIHLTNDFQTKYIRVKRELDRLGVTLTIVSSARKYKLSVAFYTKWLTVKKGVREGNGE